MPLPFVRHTFLPREPFDQDRIEGAWYRSQISTASLPVLHLAGFLSPFVFYILLPFTMSQMSFNFGDTKSRPRDSSERDLKVREEAHKALRVDPRTFGAHNANGTHVQPLIRNEEFLKTTLAANTLMTARKARAPNAPWP